MDLSSRNKEQLFFLLDERDRNVGFIKDLARYNKLLLLFR